MDLIKPLVQRPTLWLLIGGVVLLGMSAFFYRNVEQFSASDRLIRHTHRVVVAITKAVSSLREAEAVQRGYIISGENSYLLPYDALVQSVHQNWDDLKRLTVDDAAQQQRIARLEPLITEKLADLDLTIKVRSEQDFAAAQRLLMNHYGKDVMDIIRVEVDAMLAEEAKLMVQRNEDAEVAYRTSIATIMIFLSSGLLLMLLSLRLIRNRQQTQLAAAEARRRHDAELEEKIMSRTAQVRQLASHLESVREEEKRAIARELHDDIGSSMTALSMILEGHFRANADHPAIAKSAEKVRALLKEVTHSTRRIQSGLRPNTLDTLGLVEAMRELVGSFSQRTGVVSDIRLPPGDAAIPTLLQVPLFRMLQESLNNVAKHAKASHVVVTFVIEREHVLLQIEDDGIGITPERAGNAQTHGLLGMRERAAYLDGTAEIASRPGRGTIVTIRLPLAASPSASKLPELTQTETEADRN
ncbi:MAG: CHASE3 domain-containing protein [Pseudomonadota bacterium]